MKKLIFVLFPFFMLACKEERLGNILSEDDMVNLMIDIHLTQAELQVRNFGHEENKRVYSRVLNDSIIKKRGWEINQVEESIDYYLHHIPQYSDIYERVLDSLTLKESLHRNK